ncbi:short-chain dehydrogenase, partial [Metarhizium majus ARSEF 297]
MSDAFNPYADLYANPSGPGDQRPTALKVVEDSGAKGTWAGRVVLVTGGTAGIGVETVRAMHSTGADVYFTARSLEKAAATKADVLKTSSGKGKLEVVEMDLDSLDSVRKAAKDFLGRSSKLNVLINNAGIMACPYSKTKDGFERQFAVNHLAHYLFTRLLLPTLISSSTPAFNSRIINVSSSGHGMSPVNFDNYNFDQPDSYDPWLSYGQSKTANIWTASYLDRALGSRGVHALSLHPGGIWTGLATYLPDELVDSWKSDERVSTQMLNPPQGAATSVWAAVAPVWEGKGGKYLTNCSIASNAAGNPEVLDPGAAPHAYDVQAEDRLWELSAKLVGVEKDV